MPIYDNPDEDPRSKKPKFPIPEGFEDEQDFLTHMRKEFLADITFDQLNREAGVEDLRFVVGDQWDDATRQRREVARKPCLTVNRLPAFVAQVVGNRRLNETTIKVLPDSGGDEATARVREGLIRSMQKISRAELAYDKACENQVICGIGNFSIELAYEGDDVFNQTIKICQIPDAFAVVWDRKLTEPTGADADHVFVVDHLPMDDFERRWPWANPSDIAPDTTLLSDLRASGWVGESDVRIVSYWRMVRKPRTLALMLDGTTRDITNDNSPETLAAIAQRADGSPIMREVKRHYAELYICSGTDILDAPYVGDTALPISRVPVIRVPGWEVSVGDFKHRWGLVRFLKDPQRIHNFSRSVLMEKMMSAPRAKWLAGQSAVQGREKLYEQAHLTDNMLLTYDDQSAAEPKLISATQLEPAWVELSEISAQDLKDVSNIHEANLGMPSNEVSGAAIMARQRVSDTGTILYHDNLNQAIEEAGRVINDLIPIVFDTPRIIKVLGEDGTQDLVAINQIGAVDISAGKYAVTVSTGPSFQTKRIEAAQSMVSFINAAPQVAAYTMDLVAKNMDWPGADDFVKRIQFTLPQGMISEKDMTPELATHYAAQQQGQQMQSAIMAKQIAAQLAKIQSETALNFARASNAQADAEATPLKVATAQTATASQAADRELRGHLEAIRVAGGE